MWSNPCAEWTYSRIAVQVPVGARNASDGAGCEFPTFRLDTRKRANQSTQVRLAVGGVAPVDSSETLLTPREPLSVGLRFGHRCFSICRR
jgi:hypothetical protein